MTSGGAAGPANWMRRTEQSMLRARALLNMVLPTPGTSSISRCLGEQHHQGPRSPRGLAPRSRVRRWPGSVRRPAPVSLGPPLPPASCDHCRPFPEFPGRRATVRHVTPTVVVPRNPYVARTSSCSTPRVTKWFQCPDRPVGPLLPRTPSLHLSTTRPPAPPRPTRACPRKGALTSTSSALVGRAAPTGKTAPRHACDG